jgi:hypothetical protein
MRCVIGSRFGFALRVTSGRCGFGPAGPGLRTTASRPNTPAWGERQAGALAGTAVRGPSMTGRHLFDAVVRWPWYDMLYCASPAPGGVPLPLLLSLPLRLLSLPRQSSSRYCFHRLALAHTTV